MVPSVLVVENDTPVRFLLRVLLEREGFGVTEAANGNEALVHLGAGRFDVIITDLMMPELSGYELLELLGKPVRRPNVIVLTAVPRPDAMVMKHPAVHSVIRKPFDITALMDSVRAVCQRHLLIIEDDEPAQYLARRATESAGYRVTTASDGVEALRQLAENDFDAVVVDLRLPIISGYDVIDHIASKPPCPPIVVLSVVEQPKLRVPVDAILHKPEGFDMLVPTLRSVV